MGQAGLGEGSSSSEVPSARVDDWWRTLQKSLTQGGGGLRQVFGGGEQGFKLLLPSEGR